MSDMEGGEIYKLVEHISGTRTEDEHFHAVQAQCQFVSQIYLGLLHMSAQGNGLAAESLLRTTFESAVNCIILAKHKAKLPDFIRYGQFTDLRLLRFNTLPSPIKERVDRLIQATDPDWTPLCK